MEAKLVILTPLMIQISCFHAGDTYANNNPYKVAIVIAFAQQHNRLASMLQTINPQWDDEKLFQEARFVFLNYFSFVF